MIKGEYPTAFPLKHQQKDLRLALELAESLAQTLPVAHAANAHYLKSIDKGLGDADFSAVLEAVE
jgi:glyoxylate/succinic semialdehyde reductase